MLQQEGMARFALNRHDQLGYGRACESIRGGAAGAPLPRALDRLDEPPGRGSGRQRALMGRGRPQLLVSRSLVG
jgi:hypothetical protein